MIRGLSRRTKSRGTPAAAHVTPRSPIPHPSGAKPPALPPEALPKHVALVMDGNGRWAKDRGLPRTKGHEQGEHSLFDTIEGAIELGIPYLSAYAFSTENWKRSPDEVRWLMGFNRDVIHRRRDQLEEMSKHNSTITLQFCVNYGGQAEVADAAAAIARDVAAGNLHPDRITEKVFARYLYHPEVPEVDLFLRPSGEQRTSNFMLWQSAYAELIFMDTLWPDFDRRHLWHACELYAQRDRRFGGAIPNPVPPQDPRDLGL
jgi:trans,polycis-polyprenyl diphosphate synthase